MKKQKAKLSLIELWKFHNYGDGEQYKLTVIFILVDIQVCVRGNKTEETVCVRETERERERMIKPQFAMLAIR